MQPQSEPPLLGRRKLAMDEYSRELQENVRLLATTSTTASTQASSSESSTRDGVIRAEAMGDIMFGLQVLNHQWAATTQASSSESSTQDVVNHEAMGEFMRGLRKLLATTQASSSRNVEEPTRESTAFQDSAIGNVKRQ